VLGLYGMLEFKLCMSSVGSDSMLKFFCFEILLLLNMADIDRWKTVE